MDPKYLNPWGLRIGLSKGLAGAYVGTNRATEKQVGGRFREPEQCCKPLGQSLVIRFRVYLDPPM